MDRFINFIGFLKKNLSYAVDIDTMKKEQEGVYSKMKVNS
jgi:hypothetical protein